MPWWRLLFLPAAAYQILCIVSILRYARRRTPENEHRPPISVLKPVLGVDPNTYNAFRSQVQQDYPQFEVLFAIRDPHDPVITAIQQLQREFPAKSIRLIDSTTSAPNGKVGSLIDLAREARYPVWVVNDGDIAVSPSYLSQLASSLGEKNVGVVTCPYRVDAHSAATRWEALGIVTDFMPSVMVAEMLGMRDFGLGSTLAFRAADLKAAGGFESLAGYLADDFQLAHRIAKSGKRALLSRYVVETSLGESTWTGVWRHQLRWARTIRRSKGAGYAGLPFTHAACWALIAFACGDWTVAGWLIGLRILAGGLAALVLRARSIASVLWLAPVWDVFAFAIWAGAWAGKTVRWRGRKLRIAADGKIEET